jgi:hypothetical protein
VRAFLLEHPEFELAAQRQLSPVLDKVDGAYAARLLKKG